MSDEENSSSKPGLVDAAVEAMIACEEESDTEISGAPMGAIAERLQEEYGIDHEAATDAIVDAHMEGRSYLTKEADDDNDRHLRAAGQTGTPEDPRDDIATTGNTNASSDVDGGPHPTREDFDIPPEEMGPTQPPEESDDVPADERDHILDDEEGSREPEFPGAMTGESIRLRGDEGEDFLEPRSMY